MESSIPPPGRRLGEVQEQELGPAGAQRVDQGMDPHRASVRRALLRSAHQRANRPGKASIERNSGSVTQWPTVARGTS